MHYLTSGWSSALAQRLERKIDNFYFRFHMQLLEQLTRPFKINSCTSQQVLFQVYLAKITAQMRHLHL